MAAQTGSTYISGTMIDSIEIPLASQDLDLLFKFQRYPP